MSIHKLYNPLSLATYQFRNKNLRLQALTHSSYEHPEEGINNNERLEFLGDAVLLILSTIFIFTKFPGRNEGELTKLRSKMVCNESLSQIAKELQLRKEIRVGESLASSLYENSKIWSNTVEALIGAIFLDLKMDLLQMQDILFPYFDSITRDISQNERTQEPNFLESSDPISSLQIWSQKSSRGLPSYEYKTVNKSNHVLEFSAEVFVQGKSYGCGVANSKKEAKKIAAKTALLRISSGSI